jgi:RNA polymerase sigma factor (sigma-70 family)
MEWPGQKDGGCTRRRRETPAAVLPESASGDDIADRQALGALVRQALARLPRQQRAVLVLRYCEDLSEAEVAGMLGCTAGTVKTHAHRGLRALRDLLGDEFDRYAVNQTRASQRDSG